jgi:transcriptional regulator
MYIPAEYRLEDRETIMRFLNSESFGMLLSCGKEGVACTHIPYLIEEENEREIVFFIHIARANPHWRAYELAPEAMLVVQGPHGYISPSLYAKAESVPTWNYVVAHLKGRVSFVSNSEVRPLLRKLTAFFDAADAERFDSLSEAYLSGLENGIVALRFRATKWEVAFKLSQDKPEEDRKNILTYLKEQGNGLAEWM